MNDFVAAGEMIELHPLFDLNHIGIVPIGHPEHPTHSGLLGTHIPLNHTGYTTDR